MFVENNLRIHQSRMKCKETVQAPPITGSLAGETGGSDSAQNPAVPIGEEWCRHLHNIVGDLRDAGVHAGWGPPPVSRAASEPKWVHWSC